MLGFLSFFGKLLSGDVIGRAFDVIDKKVAAETDRERLKADVLQTWLKNRTVMPWYVDFCFIGPLAVWWASVILYSIFWCQKCAFAQSWSIAALPAPLDQWAGWIILSRFGAGMVQQYMARK